MFITPENLKLLVKEAMSNTPGKKELSMKPFEELNPKAKKNIIERCKDICPEEEMIGFLFTTFLESGKEGFLLTAQGIFNKDFRSKNGTTDRILFENTQEVTKEGKDMIRIRTQEGEDLIHGSMYTDYLIALLTNIIQKIAEPFYEKALELYKAKDYEALYPVLLESASRCYPKALNLLGICHDTGCGIDVSESKAQKCYEYAAQLGLPAAYSNLGILYGREIQQDGKTVVRDLEKSIQSFKKGAELGNSMAQFKLGNAYYLGNGVPRDDKTAFYWLEKSAAQGLQKAVDKLKELKPDFFAQKDMGTRVQFGCYPFDQDNNIRSIDWIITDKKDDAVLLISDQIIDITKFASMDHLSYLDITGSETADFAWDSSSLRTWLNQDFLNTAFSKTEQSYLKTTTVVTPDNELFEAYGGEPTQDRVFILSMEEMMTYFSDGDSPDTINLSRETSPCWNAATPYAMAKKELVNNELCSWTRSPGMSTSERTFLNEENGEFIMGGVSVDEYCGIRPAVWIKSK